MAMVRYKLGKYQAAAEYSPAAEPPALLEAREQMPEYGPEPPAGREAEYNVIFIDKSVKEIPLLGLTAAGRPIDFGDLDPDPPTRPWDERLIRGDIKDYYCVGVRGTSMIMADIYDGDYVLLRRAEDFENGAIMLVRCEDSSTLKRVRIAEGPAGREEVSICWEDGSGQSVRLRGEGYEAQGKLAAVERTGERTENITGLGKNPS
jgi:phage repressor protein C with HTH and peptisase S24 domain